MNPHRKLYNRWIVLALRLLVGAVFVVSGFSKLVDIWGFIFKIQEYIGAMGLDVPRVFVAMGASVMAGFEFVGGLLLLLGAYKRTIPWLLTLMTTFLLLLTLWTWIADPVSDCGCFGELFTLSNAATFWKNVVLMGALVYLSMFNRYFRHGVYEPAIQWVVVATLTGFSIFVAFYGYHVQPMLDFRPYPIGTDLAAMLSGDTDDGIADEFEFVYEKDGERRTFAIDALPDSTWTFVERHQISASKTPTGFTIYDGNDDVTDAVITGEGEQLVFVVPESTTNDLSYAYAANEFNRAVERDGGSSIGLVSAKGDELARWNEFAMSSYPFYTADDTPLKQLARGSIALVYLRDGVIQWKRTLSAFDFETIDAVGSGEMKISDIAIDDRGFLRHVALIVVCSLAILALFQEFIIRIWRKTVNLHKRKRKPAADAQSSTETNTNQS